MLTKFRNWLIVALLRVIIFTSRPLPFQKRVTWGGNMIAFFVSNVPSAANRVYKNLEMVYPQNTHDQNKVILKNVSQNFGMNLVEFYNMKEFGARQKDQNLVGDGVSLLEELIAQDKPAIFISGHFGNWEVFRAYMAARGKPLASLYKENKNPHYERIFLDFLTHSGPAFTTGVRGMSGLIRHLREGEMISLLHDQRVKGAPLLKFMGLDAHTSLATAEMALKYDIPIIPIYAKRLGGHSEFSLEIEAPFELSTAKNMAQAMNDSLERQVRATPDQWYWFHDRWHTKVKSQSAISNFQL